MITDLDETIKKLLIAEMPIENRQVEISFKQPSRNNSQEWSNKPTLNLYLFDVRENNVLRQHQWEPMPGGNGRDKRAHVKRSPMRVDCHYMLTTWATDPDIEHRLLARALLALFRFPTLPEGFMPKGSRLQEQPFPIQARLASHDKLTNPAEVWSALDNEMRPSISYVVTLALDPWKETEAEHPVLPDGRSLRLGQMTFISGTVRGKDQDGQPVADIEVTIKHREKSLVAKTDRQGHFRLGPMIPGAYTLVAGYAAQEPIEQPIRVIKPGEQDGFDLEI